MRGLYLDILKAIYDHARRTQNWDVIANLLVNINHDSVYPLDQDIVDLISDFYFFVVYGHRSRSYPDGIKSWDELRNRIDRLAQLAPR